MTNVQLNILEVEELLEKVRNHCMCLKFTETESHYMVIFPDGEFFANGVRVSKTLGKIKALKIMLEKMEYFWVSSFPGYIPDKKD